MRLALALGRTLTELLTTIPAWEIPLWLALNQVDPIGELRADMRAGIIASTIANCHRTKGKAYQATDFMPFLNDAPKDPMPASQVLAAFKALKFSQEKDASKTTYSYGRKPRHSKSQTNSERSSP